MSSRSTSNPLAWELAQPSRFAGTVSVSRSIASYARRRTECFRMGHDWVADEIVCTMEVNPAQCQRCGANRFKTWRWRDLRV